MRITSTATSPATADESPEPVKHAQEELLRAGYTLPRYGADGQFGRETALAVSHFQQGHGLPATGRLDAPTLRALEQAAANPPSPEYDALFADGVLHAVMAVGYDEAGSHEAEQARVLEGLAARGYQWIPEEQLGALGLNPDGHYLTRQLGDTKVILELISPDDADAKERFAHAMRNSEVVLYGGHGRYGSGPDFDDIHSAAGNFVMGTPSEAGHVTLGPNDLSAAPLTADYQLMFFDGCNTFRYFDDLRSKAQGKTTKNLDIVGSTTELFWNVTASNLLTMLDGITQKKNLAELESSLDENNRAGPGDKREFFRGDGFEDNARSGG